MIPQLDIADNVRREVSPKISGARKSEFGQFMTPSSVARFMANMFPASNIKNCRLLDAGAGVGALTCAFLDRWLQGGFKFDSIEVTAYEVDEALREHLKEHLTRYDEVKAEIVAGDFIELATGRSPPSDGYTHAILNPPYKKINSDSNHRRALRSVGIETVNMYSAFVALAVLHASKGGQIVAIIPRSFCNGPYYKPFREFILERCAIHHIHLFESRNKAFRDDEVLQENVIIRLECGGVQGDVTITTSTDDRFSDMTTHEHPFGRIVFPNDKERFIHVPTTLGESALELSPAIQSSLADIGVQVSTGPVVDFRLKEHLRILPEEGCAPLVYPMHLTATGTIWPVIGLRKPNAIMRNEETERWLYPNGYYCVVRRFSSKEEKRRVVASIVEPSAFGDHTVLGFENHLNLFHEKKHGLPEFLARGLVIYLNTTAVDESFRRFNGHTQVNATDLKLMKYPSREVLIELGKWANEHEELTQEMVDEQLRKIL
ncbi:SAM-dependent methyltransferase [Gammaproteobacteria bacterium LSUCC0112]|nr:SAM-dependent methyltransferase [Gammaproteobacteria bacterium LSUCC0112]